MDKQTESLAREKFEKMFKSEWHPDKTGPYAKDSMWFAWEKAWQASRESFVVDLPVCADVNSAKSFAGRAMLTGKNSAITKCADAIRAIGIRIKGEGV
ncbi:hypothetical protein [Serratia fonticola]